MKTAFLIVLMAVPATVLAVEDHDKYEAYKQRRAERRAYAIEARREHNAGKGPHVYHTATTGSVPITPFIAIEKGWVSQPPIPVVTIGVPRTHWIPKTFHHPHPYVDHAYVSLKRRLK